VVRSQAMVALGAAFDAFRKAIYGLIASQRGTRRRSGSFAVEILGKRLLSCPVAFADSWRRCKEGLAEDRAASESDVQAVRRSVESETGDDRETHSRVATAANVVGAWLKGVAGELKDEIAAIDDAVSALGLDGGAGDLAQVDPVADSRYTALVALVEKLLRRNGEWRDDERLVVFTEYKTTLDYLLRRVRESFPGDDERFLSLYGRMDEVDRCG